MGERIHLLMPYQVNRDVIAATRNPAVKFMHCLPAFHNAETVVGREIEKRFGLATRTNLPCGAPLVNRATAGKYPPGSTFKMVTAAAALDTGRFTPDSPFYDPGYCEQGETIFSSDKYGNS